MKHFAFSEKTSGSHIYHFEKQIITQVVKHAIKLKTTKFKESLEKYVVQKNLNFDNENKYFEKFF